MNEEFPSTPADPNEVPPQPEEEVVAPAPTEDEEPPAETSGAAESSVAEAATPVTSDEEEPQGEESSPVAPVPVPAAEEAPAPTPSKKQWYIIKVTSGREESIKAAIERRVKIEGLEEYFGQIYIPVEKVIEVKKVKETKNGEKVTKEKRVTKERKKFPGYIMAEVEFNDRILYLFRETSGVGDFVGAGGPGKPPPPMTEIEVKRMFGDIIPGEEGQKKGRKTVVKLDFEKGDKVRIREGAFANMEGEVKEITEPKEAGETPKVTVVVPIFGRPVEVGLEYWQVDKV